MTDITFRVHSYSNLQCPLENCKAGSGYISAREAVRLRDDQNVRSFLEGAETPVSKQIKSSFRSKEESEDDYPEKFAVLNGGITIFAKKMAEDPKKVYNAEKAHVGWDLTLSDPSVINGAQTRGLLASLLDSKDPDVVKRVEKAFVRYEFLVSEDEELADDVSIIRNSQTAVQFISILNKSGVLEDLEKSVKAYSIVHDSKEWSLRKRETDSYTSSPPWKHRKDYCLDTERLIQVLIAMTPDVLLADLKSYTALPAAQHSTRLMQALRDFERAKEKDYLKPLYDFYIQFAPRAWMLWQEWCWFDKDSPEEERPGNWWKTSMYTNPNDELEEEGDDSKPKKKRLQKRRVEGATIVPKKSEHLVNGLGFPVLSALSEFCVQMNGRWTWECPAWFDKREKLRFMQQCVVNASGKANDFGHRKDAYEMVKSILKDRVMARSAMEKDVALQEKDVALLAERERVRQLERELASLKKTRR